MRLLLRNWKIRRIAQTLVRIFTFDRSYLCGSCKRICKRDGTETKFSTHRYCCKRCVEYDEKMKAILMEISKSILNPIPPIKYAEVNNAEIFQFQDYTGAEEMRREDTANATQREIPEP
jgi:hypothetical protein